LKFDFNEGILSNVLAMMKNRGNNMLLFQKIIVLTFDEMYISYKIEIDKKYE